jgi:hypothetical protein
MKKLILVLAMTSLTASAFADSACKDAADKVIANSRYRDASYENCRGNTCTYSYQQGDGGDSCSYDVNVSIKRDGNSCVVVGKPELDESTANCG